ncbi:VOC family protein [Allokutzneria oryzae]|uniref:VOC family protein n=1 Tax=Allokutzneria oryzae TaxID=1378989 RepID=A0ABV5ZRQ2_9PSEU
MSDNRGPAPAGSPNLTMFFAVPDSAKALEYYREVFGAEVLERFDAPDGTVAHAEIALAGGRFQLSEPMPDYGIVGQPAEGNSFTMTLWTNDVDAVFERAVASGSTVLTPLADSFSGARMGVVRCPFGIRWCIARHDRDVPQEEIDAAVAAMYEQG